ncbi:MAG: hypothetical protein AAB263_15155 [Planctomycetota bacterium]
MIGAVPPTTYAPAVQRIQKAHAPIYRVQRELDLLGVAPYRQFEPLPPGGKPGPGQSVNLIV